MILDLETFYFHMSPLLLSRSSELDSDEAEMELLDVSISLKQTFSGMLHFQQVLV